jgi:hypothetical protein
MSCTTELKHRNRKAKADPVDQAMRTSLLIRLYRNPPLSISPGGARRIGMSLSDLKRAAIRLQEEGLAIIYGTQYGPLVRLVKGVEL